MPEIGDILTGLLSNYRPPIGGAVPTIPFGWGANYGAPTIGATPWQPAPYDLRPWGLGDQSAAAFGRYYGQTSNPGAYILGRNVPGNWRRTLSTATALPLNNQPIRRLVTMVRRLTQCLQMRRKSAPSRPVCCRFWVVWVPSARQKHVGYCSNFGCINNNEYVPDVLGLPPVF